MKNIYLITGNDEARIASAAEELFRQLAGDDPDPFASDVINVNEGAPPAAALVQTVDSVMTPSFFGGGKVVWLRHFPAFELEGTSKTETPVGKAMRALAERLEKGIPDGVSLIMDGSGCDKKKAFWKTCQKIADVRECSRPDMKNKFWRDDMRACIQAAAARHGLQLSVDVTESLIDMFGCSSDVVDAELEKLACFCGGNPPTRADVEEICTPCGEEQVWSLGDFLSKRDLKGALNMIETMASKTPDGDGLGRSLIFNVFNNYADMIRVKVFMARHGCKRPNDLKNYLERRSEEEKRQARAEMDAIGTMHPYRAFLKAEGAARYVPHELVEAVAVLRDALWQTTSSDIRPVVALENALMKILPARPMAYAGHGGRQYGG